MTDWLHLPPARPDPAARAAALARQATLTKPPGALGALEQIAVELAALQGVERPEAERVGIAIFAADHGVAAQGVSAFPQAVTAAMVRNFAQGGAAIAVLARTLGARLEVVELGTAVEVGEAPGVLHRPLGPGSADLSRGPAMTTEQLRDALAEGRASVERALQAATQLYLAGEMGIGNTTSAAALACALLDARPEELAGPGTGLDPAGVARKAAVIARALALHRPHLWKKPPAGGSAPDPVETLRRLGGFEIAALVGAYVACAQRGLPVLVDGFIASVAALAAERIRPGSTAWFLYAHASAEPGHARVLAALGARPLLDLGMRLGEGSGAAVAVPLVRLACALHNGMATFAEAGIGG